MALETVNQWLDSILPAHERLTGSTEALVRSLIKNAKIDHLSIGGRTKTKNGCIEKIRRKKYNDPRNQLTDISGVRIVTYFESQVAEISDLIRATFDVDHKNSLDRVDILGMDKIGYRSVHFVCALGAQREALQEYKNISALKFEIQVRTVLQHAWAELAHDRAYKFSGVLPPNLQRKLNLYAGMLEVVDAGFDEISKEVDEYAVQIDRVDQTRLNDIDLNSLSISEYIERANKKHGLSLAKQDIDLDVVEELKAFGLSKIGEIDRLANADFFEAHKKFFKEDTYVGFLRNIMLYDDMDLYFRNAWNERWKACDEDTVKFLKLRHGKRVLQVLEELEIHVDEDDDYVESVWDDS